MRNVAGYVLRLIRWGFGLAVAVHVGVAAAQLAEGEWVTALVTTIIAVVYALAGFVIAPAALAEPTAAEVLRDRRERMEGKK